MIARRRARWHDPAPTALEVMAAHQPDPAGTCVRCTSLGVGSHGDRVNWPCGAYLAARHRAVRAGLTLPDDGLNTPRPR